MSLYSVLKKYGDELELVGTTRVKAQQEKLIDKIINELKDAYLCYSDTDLENRFKLTLKSFNAKKKGQLEKSIDLLLRNKIAGAFHTSDITRRIDENLNSDKPWDKETFLFMAGWMREFTHLSIYYRYYYVIAAVQEKAVEILSSSPYFEDGTVPFDPKRSDRIIEEHYRGLIRAYSLHPVALRDEYCDYFCKILAMLDLNANFMTARIDFLRNVESEKIQLEMFPMFLESDVNVFCPSVNGWKDIANDLVKQEVMKTKNIDVSQSTRQVKELFQFSKPRLEHLVVWYKKMFKKAEKFREQSREYKDVELITPFYFRRLCEFCTPDKLNLSRWKNGKALLEEKKLEEQRAADQNRQQFEEAVEPEASIADCSVEAHVTNWEEYKQQLNDHGKMRFDDRVLNSFADAVVSNNPEGKLKHAFAWAVNDLIERFGREYVHTNASGKKNLSKGIVCEVIHDLYHPYQSFYATFGIDENNICYHRSLSRLEQQDPEFKRYVFDVYMSHNFPPMGSLAPVPGLEEIMIGKRYPDGSYVFKIENNVAWIRDPKHDEMEKKCIIKVFV